MVEDEQLACDIASQSPTVHRWGFMGGVTLCTLTWCSRVDLPLWHAGASVLLGRLMCNLGFRFELTC